MRRLAALLTALLALAITAGAASPKLPGRQTVIDGYSNPDSVMATLASMPLDVIEGMWLFSSSGARIAIVKTPRDAALSADYVAVTIDGADRSLRPGTVVGLINRGGERGTYLATFYREHHLSGIGLTGSRKFTLHLADDRAFLRFVPVHAPLRVNLPSLLPGIAGRVVRRGYANRPADGCMRVFPEPLKPVEPRYL